MSPVERARAPRRRRPSVGAIIILIALVLAVAVLSPTIEQFLAQRQRIADLEAANAASQAQIETLQVEQARWSDPAYIEAQARGRLLFVRPGDTVYLVPDGSARAGDAGSEAPAVAQHETGHDWLELAATSIVVAGTSSDPASGGAP